MATTTRPEAEVRDSLTRVDGADVPARSRAKRRSPWPMRLIVLAVVLVCVVVVAAASRQLVRKFATPSRTGLETYHVTRGDLVVTLREDGNLQSSVNIDIKCDVKGGAKILEIVEDGKMVKKGEQLVKLDSSQITDQILQQEITYAKAESSKIQAEKNLAAAELAVQEYEQGTYLQEVDTLEANIKVAMENLRTAENTLEHSQRMFRKGYVSALQVESQQFAVEKAKLDLGAAQTAKQVLQKFTKAKTLQDLISKRDTAKAQVDSETAAYNLEKGRLERLKTQEQMCNIVAPSDGMVVYANERGNMRGGQQTQTIEQGASVNEHQTILRLPDRSKMEVKVKVHESKVDQISIGMPASIRVLDRTLTGKVTSVANQPEPGAWFSSNVKEYATIVSIDGQHDGLKPGMTAECEILIAHERNVLTVPISAVVEQQGKYFCWVRVGETDQKRPLVVGLTNDEFVEIKDGVAEGDEVVRNPRAKVPEARQEANAPATGQPSVDVQKKFGGDAIPEAAGSNNDGGRRGGSAGAPGGPGTGERTKRGKAGPGAAGRSMDMMSYDKDGDGKVSKSEAPEFMQNFFDRLDTNGDGFVDKAEADEAARRFRERGAGQGRGAGGPPGRGGGPNGGPTSGPG